MSGYHHPAHHRKVEFLADEPGLELLHITFPGSGRADGFHPSANGRSRYQTQTIPVRWLGQSGDPHRAIHLTRDLSLRRFRPDLIHCEHEQESLMAAQTALARRWWRPTAPLVLFTFQNILRPRNLAVRLVCWYTLRAAQHVECANTEAVTVLRRQGYTGGASFGLTHGVDTRYFYPSSAAADQAPLGLKGFVAGYIGRLTPEKGLKTLLEAVAQAGPDVTALLVGDGPEKAALERLAQHLGIRARVRFVPNVPYADVPKFMRVLDLLVLPSLTSARWKEQFGRVLAEAMCCRIAVAGSDSGAIPEVIGPAGRIFPEGQAAALAQILNDLAAQPAQCQALAELGYRRSCERYTAEPLAQGTLAVWRQLVPGDHAHRD